MTFYVRPDTGPRDAIRHALVWRQPPGSLARLPGPMAEYALYAVLHFQRRMSDYFEQQRTVIWQRRDELLARQWPVGVMGLGVIGATVSSGGTRHVFFVTGMRRTPHEMEL